MEQATNAIVNILMSLKPDQRLMVMEKVSAVIVKEESKKADNNLKSLRDKRVLTVPDYPDDVYNIGLPTHAMDKK